MRKLVLMLNLVLLLTAANSYALPVEDCVDDELLEKVEGYAGETHYGPSHVYRWQSVLVAWGYDYPGVTAMTQAEAQEKYDNYMKSRWGPILESIKCINTPEEQVVFQEEPLQTSASTDGTQQSTEVTVDYPGFETTQCRVGTYPDSGGTSVVEGWYAVIEGATQCPQTAPGGSYPSSSNDVSDICLDVSNCAGPKYLSEYMSCQLVNGGAHFTVYDNGRVEGTRTFVYEADDFKPGASGNVSITVEDDDVSYVYLETATDFNVDAPSDTANPPSGYRECLIINDGTMGWCYDYWQIRVTKPIKSKNGPLWWENEDFVYARIDLANVVTRQGVTREGKGSSAFIIPPNKSGSYRLFDRPQVGPKHNDVSAYQLSTTVNFPNCAGGGEVLFKSLIISVSRQNNDNYDIRVRPPAVDTDLCNP